MSTAKDNATKVNTALGLKEEMTKNTSGQTLTKVLEDVNLESLMGSGVPMATLEEVMIVRANNEWTLSVAEAIIDAAYMYQNQIDLDVITPELLSLYIQWVILNRINFLENGRNEVHPKNVCYPTLMYDALCRITRYDGAVKDGAQIIPSIGEAEIDEDAQEVLEAWMQAQCNRRQFNENAVWEHDSWIDDTDRVRAFPGHDNLERLLKVAGVEMATGLPMTRKSTIRTMFEMNVDTEGYVTTAGQAPTVADVFSRCFYDFQALANLVGVQKVELLLYSTLREKLLDIANGYVKNFRG